MSKYQKEIKNGLKTEPFARVIDDGKVVGIITIADQFIPVNDLMSEDKIDFNEPEEKDLKTIYSSNYLQVDKAIALNKEQDKLRIANVKILKWRHYIIIYLELPLKNCYMIMIIIK